MQAFKLFFKIFKKSALVSSILYIAIFSLLSLLFLQNTQNNSSKSFSVEKAKVAVIDNDKSDFSKEFHNYIKNNTKVIVV